MAQQITHLGLDEAVKQSPKKWVYLFSEGNAKMRELLGGKGAGVAEMTNAGLPVPPGFTITTEACNAYGDERFAYDAYRRFIQMFSKIVLDTDPQEFERVVHQYKERVGVKTDAEISATDLKKLVVEFKQIAERQSGQPFLTDVYEQLKKAIEAVFSSWNNKRAIDYRNFNKIPHNLGTAVNVQSMVFGNMGNDSGTGLPSHAILALVRLSLRRKAKSRQTTPWAMTGR